MLRVWWDRTDPVVRDWWPVAVVVVLQQIGALSGDVDHQSVLVILAGLGAAVPLRWRAEHPLAMALAVAVSVTVQVLLVSPSDPPFGSFLALMVASFSTAAHLPLPLAAAGPLLASVPAVLLALLSPTLPMAELVFPMVYFGGSWGLGRITRRRHATSLHLADLVRELASEREENARLAAESERHRIARDIHDVVAHSLGVILIQSEAAEAMLDYEPHRVLRPLEIIQRTARSSLDELRGVLGAMRAEQPMPTLATVPELVERFRTAGLATQLEMEGATDGPAVPHGVEVTAYRVVQEALTNVLRHAPGAAASVVLQRDHDGIRVRVSDDGPPTDAPASGGFGLTGMRERVTGHGGHLTVGPGAGGGFQVDAILPTAEIAP